MTRLCVSRTSRLVIGMVLIVLGVTQPSWVEVVNADGEGWYSSWQLRKAITIDATKVSSGPHTNFPVLVNLSSDASLASRAQSDGDDILFTSSDGATKLSHEIEKYGSSTGELVAWVKVPSLSSASNTVLYMYYGNDAAASQQNATAVWDANYTAVWHLKETPLELVERSRTVPRMPKTVPVGPEGLTYRSLRPGRLVGASTLTGLGTGSVHSSPFPAPLILRASRSRLRHGSILMAMVIIVPFSKTGCCGCRKHES